MVKLLNWFMDKMDEFILFLEYPLDYIEEYGDSLKGLSAGQKALRIGKTVLVVYGCVMLIYFALFLLLCKVFFGGGAGNSVAEGIYEDALRSEAEAAQRAADSGAGSYAAADAVRQELDNLK